MQNSTNLLPLLIDISSDCLYIFYAIIVLRWASARMPVLSRTTLGLSSNSGWVSLAFYGTVTLMILASLLYNSPVAKDVFGPWQAWSVLSLIVALATLFPHIVVAVEYRMKPSGSTLDTLRHILMVTLAFASIPQALILVNEIMIWGDIHETHPRNQHDIGEIIRKYFILPENFMQDDLAKKSVNDLGLFWFDQTFQATLWNIPSTFGFKLSNAQPQPTNRFMSVLILINQFTLYMLSFFMVFAAPIKRAFRNTLSRPR